MNGQKRVLIIESDPEVANLLIDCLSATLPAVADLAPDGHAAVSMAEAFDYDLITLELLVPKLGGPQLCKALREARPAAPLLAVTARADAVASLLGSQAGFDDYVFKPFVARDLAEKAQALLRRARSVEAPGPGPLPDLRLGNASFSAAARSIVLEGRTLSKLSLAEFELLHFLAGQAGTSFPEEEILETLWGLRPPVRLKHLSVDLRHLQQKMRGLLTGFRYLSVTDRERIRFEIPDGETIKVAGRTYASQERGAW